MMALYLDDQTRGWLERKTRNVADTDFIGKRVQKMIETDSQRLDDMAVCDHQPVHYIGEKTCCGRCGSFYEKGMGQTWTMAIPQQYPQPPAESWITPENEQG